MIAKNFSKTNAVKKQMEFSKNTGLSRRKVLSVSQILARATKQKQKMLEGRKSKKPMKPIISSSIATAARSITRKNF